jgi:hypothetical protein
MRIRIWTSIALALLGVWSVEKIAFWLTDWIVGMLERADRVEDASMTMSSFPVRYSLQLISARAS